MSRPLVAHCPHCKRELMDEIFPDGKRTVKCRACGKRIQIGDIVLKREVPDAD